jgi:hypothetical protein
MAGRPKKIVESTQEEVVNEVVNVEVAEVTKEVATIEVRVSFQNIPGVGCLVTHYSFYTNVPIDMTTTFLPNVKGEYDENKNVIFSHINS